MSRVALPLLLLTLAWVPWTASAEPAWDDSHMRSNFDHRFDHVPPRPPIQGIDRYRQLREAPTPTPSTAIPETTLTLNPHGWKPGVGRGARDVGPVAQSHSGSRLESIGSLRRSHRISHGHRSSNGQARFRR